MKKNFLLTGLLALALGALSSCGSDDEAALTEETNTVTFTLSPEKAVNTRAFGAKGVTTRGGGVYYLRYKMSVYNAGTGKKIDGADAVKMASSYDPISFSVTLPKGTAYTCVFWTDVVTDPSGATDLYYNTSDMETISFTTAAGQQEADTSLLQAFRGTATIDAAGQVSETSVSLKYAVAQLNIKTTAAMTGVKNMSVACGNIAMDINALTGKVTQSATEVIYLTYVSQTPATPESPANLISIFLLAPAEGMTLDAVTLGMITEEGDVVKSIEIQNVPLKRCYRTNITGDLSITHSNSFGVNMDQEFEGDEPTIDPDKVVKLGTYYYMDGTWSNTLDEDKEVAGIVFYAGRHPRDTDTYKDLNGNEMTDIHGYAIITDDAASPLAWGPTDIRCGTSASFFDWCGYSDQQIIMAAAATADKGLENWPAVNICVENNANVPDGFKLSSGLFLPSYAQMECVYNNRDAIEAILETVDDGEAFKDDNYLTSRENDTDVSRMSVISFRSGDPISDTKDRKYSFRPILVF